MKIVIHSSAIPMHKDEFSVFTEIRDALYPLGYLITKIEVVETSGRVIGQEWAKRQ